MTDYTKRCWYCGSKNMEKVETWYKCADCGATHVVMPETFKGGLFELATGGIQTNVNPRGSSYQPTKKVAQEASKARKAKA